METRSCGIYCEDGKDPTPPSSCGPISLLYTVGKLLEKMLLTLILRVVNELDLLFDEHFGFRTSLSMTLQLARLDDRVDRNLEEKSVTGAIFLDVANPSKRCRTKISFRNLLF
jgi:hypothetical protein